MKRKISKDEFKSRLETIRDWLQKNGPTKYLPKSDAYDVFGYEKGASLMTIVIQANKMAVENLKLSMVHENYQAVGIVVRYIVKRGDEKMDIETRGDEKMDIETRGDEKMDIETILQKAADGPPTGRSQRRKRKISKDEFKSRLESLRDWLQKNEPTLYIPKSDAYDAFGYEKGASLMTIVIQANKMAVENLKLSMVHENYQAVGIVGRYVG